MQRNSIFSALVPSSARSLKKSMGGPFEEVVFIAAFKHIIALNYVLFSTFYILQSKQELFQWPESLS
jgi:hypothetical protein